MSATLVGDKSYRCGNGGYGRFRILKSHWKVSMVLIAIVCFDIGCGLELETSTPPTSSVPFIDPRTRNRIDSSRNIKENITVCTSEECKRSAMKLKEPMIPSADACEDFYEYACGNWTREHENWFGEKQENINSIVREFLKRSVEANEPKPVQNAKNLYRSCMNTDNTEKEGLQPIINILKSVGLPPFPTYGSPDHNETNEFDWLEAVVKIKANLNIDVIFVSSVMPYNSMNFLHILPKDYSGQLMRKSGAYNNGRQIISSRKSALKQQIPSNIEQEKYRKVLELFASEIWNNSEIPAHIDKQSKNYIRTHQDIVNLTKNIKPFSGNLGIVYDIIGKYIQILSRATGEHLSNIEVNTNMAYVERVAEYVSKKDRSELELYIWMQVVLKLGIYTTKKLRDIILPQYSNEEGRSELCSARVQLWFDMPIIYEVADPNIHNVTKAKISTMLHEIKNSLVDLIDQAEWMDNDAKKASYEKIHKMKSAIGYSDSNKSYDDILCLDPSKHILHNFINLKQTLVKAELQKLKKAVTCEIAETSDVNAIFYHLWNCLALPWAILQYPFYDLGLESLNYGSMGVVVGHELSHALDNDGINYDKIGMEHQWWTTNSTYDSFKNISSCFVHQYSTYQHEGLQVNGAQTLGENMADNNGVRVAFEALKRHLDGRTPEPKLPQFEHLSSEQLFFLSFANGFCGKYNDERLKELIETDVHSPLRYRINGALQNNKNFAKAWSCELGSNMNPKNKCILF